MKNLRLSLLAVCLTLCIGCPAANQRQKDIDVVSRIGVFGASLSAGFEVAPSGAPVTLAHIADTSLKLPHAVCDTSTMMFFTNPTVYGREDVDKLATFKPSLVFAVDFLFWFAYGQGMNFDARQKLLAFGLKLLEKFDCPILMGDLPDMHGADELMLPKAAIPSAQELQKLNEQILKWMESRPNCHLLPLAQWMECIRNKKPIETRYLGSRIYSLEDILQADKMHPNLNGRVLITLWCWDKLIVACPGLQQNDFIWDADALTKQASPKFQK